MDADRTVAALRHIQSGIEELIAAVSGGAASGEQDGARDAGLLLEFDKPVGMGLSRAEASRACVEHGRDPRTVGGWSRMGWIRTQDDRRNLTEAANSWLALKGFATQHEPRSASQAR